LWTKNWNMTRNCNWAAVPTFSPECYAFLTEWSSPVFPKAFLQTFWLTQMYPSCASSYAVLGRAARGTGALSVQCIDESKAPWSGTSKASCKGRCAGFSVAFGAARRFLMYIQTEQDRDSVSTALNIHVWRRILEAPERRPVFHVILVLASSNLIHGNVCRWCTWRSQPRYCLGSLFGGRSETIIYSSSQTESCHIERLFSEIWHFRTSVKPLCSGCISIHAIC
jgi:hypothetical protein